MQTNSHQKKGKIKESSIPKYTNTSEWRGDVKGCPERTKDENKETTEPDNNNATSLVRTHAPVHAHSALIV